MTRLAIQKIGCFLDHAWTRIFSDSIEMPFGKKAQQVLNIKVKKETMLLNAVVASKCSKEARERRHLAVTGERVTSTFFCCQTHAPAKHESSTMQF